MATTVTCQTCKHDADVQAPSDVWKCNCAAGFGPDGCDCSALNESDGAEDNANTDNLADQEIIALEARLLQLRGETNPKGDANV